MQNSLKALLVVLALGASGAYAQSATDSGSKYDSHSRAGDSAIWGVGE